MSVKPGLLTGLDSIHGLRFGLSTSRVVEHMWIHSAITTEIATGLMYADLADNC